MKALAKQYNRTYRHWQQKRAVQGGDQTGASPTIRAQEIQQRRRAFAESLRDPKELGLLLDGIVAIREDASCGALFKG